MKYVDQYCAIAHRPGYWDDLAFSGSKSVAMDIITACTCQRSGGPAIYTDFPISVFRWQRVLYRTVSLVAANNCLIHASSSALQGA